MLDDAGCAAVDSNIERTRCHSYIVQMFFSSFSETERTSNQLSIEL